MKIIVLIATHKKNLDKCEIINRTYGKDLKNNNIDYFFVSGDNLSFENFIKIDFKESYEQLPLKTFLMLNAVDLKRYNYVVKLNDDTFLDVKKLINLNLKGVDYAGKFNYPRKDINTRIHHYKIKDILFFKDKKTSQVEWAEGAFYILSKKSVKKILSFKKDYFLNFPENYRGEDEVVGEILKNMKKINLKDEKLSKELHMDVTCGGLSFHPVHNIIFESIYQCNCLETKVQIFKNKYYLNDYFLRDEYLKKYE